MDVWNLSPLECAWSLSDFSVVLSPFESRVFLSPGCVKLVPLLDEITVSYTDILRAKSNCSHYALQILLTPLTYFP